MTLRDFAILVAVCLVWSVNNVVSKVVVGMWHVPPLFYAGLRFALVRWSPCPGCDRCPARPGGCC